MIIFASGIPNFLIYLGVDGAAEAMKGELSLLKFANAFLISLSMNTIYAPIMMTFHKITDAHIINNGGKLKSLIQPIKFWEICKSINWDVQWNFVFMKTIPFFWIPAHTITFLLPPEWQVMFAALLGIALGVILALAGMKQVKQKAIVT